MKYYEFEYDNVWQKILWSVEIISIGLYCPIITLFAVVLFNELLPEAISITLILLSIPCAIILSIFNFKRPRGVFVFDDYIEIVGYYLLSKKIKFDDIYDLRKCEKRSYYYYTIASRGNGGGRRNCLVIGSNLSHYYIKVKNQDELINDIISKTNKDLLE